MRTVLAAESVTSLESVAGAVLVAGSHGGLIAAALAARAGVGAVILNDAGVGKEGAGVAGLAWLEVRGIPAATVGHDSARIGDGADALARGLISHANAGAENLGVCGGMRCTDAADLLAAAPARLPPASLNAGDAALIEGRCVLRPTPHGVQVRGLDSIGLLRIDDAGHVLVIGSHGGLHGGRPESALPVDAAAALFNDAGVGRDNAGISRLAALAARGIPAAAVDCMSARIGDARSMWDSGVLSHVNATAAARGARAGDHVRAFALLFAPGH